MVLRGVWMEFAYTVGSSVTFLGKFDKDSRCALLSTYIGNRRYKENGVWLKKPVEKFSDIDLLILDPDVMVKVTNLAAEYRDCDR